MSIDSGVTNGSGFHISCHNGIIRCPADAILNGCEQEDIPKKQTSPKSKSYNSVMEFCNEAADELSQRQAFYAIDLADVLWKVQEWKKSLPNVDIFYAVKANTDPVLLQLLTQLGLSFDCASGGEVQMLLNAGASPENIIFAHTIKTVEELKFASEKGVELMTFDNEDELLKIHRVYPTAKPLIRICPTRVNCLYDLSDKFGCSAEEAIRLLKLAKNLNVNVIGISFHVGSLCKDPTSYTSTIETSRRIFDVAKDLGFSFSILDIGGGFFGESGTENLLYTVADHINKSLEEHFSDSGVRIIAEPGTYIVGSACRLVTTVLGRRCFEGAVEDQPRRHYYLNEGVYGSFFQSIALYGIKPLPLLPESELQSRPKYKSKLFGQTCCCEDVIMGSVVLPDLKVGERVVWENMGAYCRGVSSTFCGVPLTVPRYMFVKDQRLTMDWIEDRKAIQNFLKKHVSFVGCTSDEI